MKDQPVAGSTPRGKPSLGETNQFNSTTSLPPPLRFEKFFTNTDVDHPTVTLRHPKLWSKIAQSMFKGLNHGHPTIPSLAEDMLSLLIN